ncbi:two-component system response regulator [Saccharospirillum sp. MSK14-1]|uniref:response regulator n=1 Tax=Saccharospirillum sp. MSK14-1 TaxID=1897632 RepID=UPI000D3BAFA2|nr:response regulator [Saccharospirillum sp. MSK14-1]PTY36858.1 two-component system response regulator [Saccharospirillum sp. MSK14-1]
MTEQPYQQVSILLVEDDDIDAMSIERSIKKMRLANPLVRVIDGVEALAVLHNDSIPKPRIVLLDLNMPRMGGLEFLEAIRNDEKLNDTVVFVLTTSQSEEEIYEAYKKNIADYIIKSSLSQDFNQVLKFLDHYWQLVVLPS